MSRTRELIGVWLPPAAYMAIIFHFSSRPSLLQPVTTWTGLSLLDKVAHFLAYALLFFLLFRAFRISGGFPPALAALVVTVLYGASDEIHQSFVPFRSCEVSDFIADCVGAVFSYFLVLRSDHERASRRE